LDLQTGDALVIMDVQNDFLPGGALGVPHGDEIVPLPSCYATAFYSRGLPVFASRDWHPPDHCSFRERGGIWPVHCVARSKGAEFHPDLHLPPGAVVVSKGTDREKEAYSAFEGTTLDGRLREAGARRLFVGGLTTDYCVLNTVRDALSRGYAVVLPADGIRAVDLRVNLPSALTPEQRDKLLKVAHGCTVHQSLAVPPKVAVRLSQ
jgi:nicotinamidase/pyrazinamidase